jgi:hypothetical protein
MIRSRITAALLSAALLAGSSSAWAWEAATTQAGLAEQAGQSSALHARLVAIGFSQGLFEPLTVPPADAPTLLKALSRMSPSEGYVPDARGRQYALGWLAAGAAVADQPASYAGNHFYDVATGKGLRRPSVGVVGRARSLLLARLGRATLPANGVPAPDWVVSKDNPLGLDGFLDQYAKAVRGSTPGERGRAMAGALVAAGAILHILGDLGAPSRVRGDGAAHLERIGPGRDDLGSRFERVAALSYGRLGVPAPSRIVTRSHLRDYFVTDAKAPAPKDKAAAPEIGLSQWVADRFFSPGTLPEDTRIGASGKVTPVLDRPLPALPERLNLMAAGQAEGTTLKDDAGTCLARYHVDDGVLRFDLDDACLLEQIAVILPEVAAYETGLLDFLFRGELAVTVANGRVQAAAKGVALGAGEVEILSEDARGVRTSVAKAAVTKADDGAALAAAVSAPAGASRLVAVFTGVDANGERIVAVGGVTPK